tara:strand:+ start:6916 stop:7629 length:714 start_codon:yes stop_codon:yes gene_type:complete
MSTSTVFPTSSLIEWSEFTIRNTLDTANEEVIENRELSAKAVSRLLMKYTFKMYTEKGVLGYNTLDSNEEYVYGISEADAFSDWIIGIKSKEKSLKNILPKEFYITQAQYDALVIFFTLTGQINKVQTVDGIYDVRTEILAKNWEKVASMIINDKRDFNLNQQAGTIMILGDYGYLNSRVWLRNQGIQRLRRKYDYITSGYNKRQAEHSYYRETQKFLPNMSEMRQREVVNYYRANP